MTNAEIARALLELAECLEIVGGADVSFRCRALRVGAQAIDALADPVAALAAEGRLTTVKGIGPGIARRVEELARTGRLEELEHLRHQVVPGLVEILHVEGVGPKTARLIVHALGVASLDDLEAAARAGKLRGLPRLGPKKEEQILAAVARARQSRGRVRLDRAEAEVAPVVERLRAEPAALRVALAGSLRRRRETVADVDVLAATEDAEAVMRALVEAPQVSLVIARGPTKVSVKLVSGLQLDLRAVPPQSFGAALHYFTGSKEHNIAVRGIGVRRGLKINEYGVFEVERDGAGPPREGRRVGGAEEEEVFAAVGLPWIPPELRENQGEIEAGHERRLPPLLARADVRGDLHMHTGATDGRASLEQMVEAAARAGHEYVAITDHSQSLRMVHGLDPERLAEQGAEIAALNERLGGRPRVLRGLEADILADGSVDLGEALRGLDWVVGSVHSYFHLPREEQTRRIVAAMESGLIDAVGHPTGRILGERAPYDLDLEALMAAAARTGVALELNSYPDRLDLCDVHCRMAREAGVRVVIDTDAHAVTHLDFLRYGVDTARRGWLEPRHVLNTLPVEQLLEHRRRRRE